MDTLIPHLEIHHTRIHFIINAACGYRVACMLKLVGGQQQINKARSTIGCVYVCDRDQISDDDDDDDDVVLYCMYVLSRE